MVDWLLCSFVSSSLQVLIGKLTDIGVEKWKSSNQVDQLEKLMRSIARAQKLIHGTEDRETSDMAWQSSLKALDKVVYDADDLIDKIVIRDIKLQGTIPFYNFFRSFATTDVSTMQTKLNGILNEIESLHSADLAIGIHLKTLVTRLDTSSLLDETRVFGREDDKKELIKMLEASEESISENNVSVIPIIGMIGVGKTTLAQLVYNYYQTTEEGQIQDLILGKPWAEKMKDLTAKLLKGSENRMLRFLVGKLEPSKSSSNVFNLKMWVSVSENFDIIGVTRSIIEAATRESTFHLLNLDSLQHKLVEILRGKKFFLVLDDLWNVKWNEWHLLLTPLRHGLKGSKIIVTTGSHDVSSLVGTARPYRLRCLSDGDCYKLLKKEALGETGLDNERMESIGMAIARKCAGLPLAAKIVGSLLQSKNTHVWAWVEFNAGNIWHLRTIRNEIATSLRSGYRRLQPSPMRQCFAYCSMFPLNYNFEKNKIIQMWMGEGFVGSDVNNTEDTGSSYFDQLYKHCFFQKKKERYMIHVFVQEMARSLSGDKFMRMEETEKPRIRESTRHLSLAVDYTRPLNYVAFSKCKGLRTVLLLDAYTIGNQEVPLALFRLEFLRVLDLSGTRIRQLSMSIGNLEHLRFLDLSNTLLTCLPKCMGELLVLQTLRLLNCSELRYLPKSIGKLERLLYLEVGSNSRLNSMPSGIGKLTSLRKLNEFLIGREKGQIKELERMDNIRGSLCIKQLENVKDSKEASKANLANKKYLDTLVLQWTSVTGESNDEDVLEKLMNCPHESLKELTLKMYGGRIFPRWVTDPLFRRLTSVFFQSCKNCVHLPPLGELPELKSLRIWGMHNLIKVDRLFLGVKGFLSLEILEFKDMPKLKCWVGLHKNDMPHLRELSVLNCGLLQSLPSLHYLQKLEKLIFEDCPNLETLSEETLSRSVKSLIINDCDKLEEKCMRGGDDWMKIQHIPDKVIGYKIIA